MSENRHISPINGLPLPAPYPKGVSGNPGGVPKGKRISTWMAEFGEMEDKDLPVVGSKKWEKLPKNARIALRRLRAADAEEELGLANSKYVEPREVASLMSSENAVPAIEMIATAILALKNAGVVVRNLASNPEPIDAEVVTPVQENAETVQVEETSPTEEVDDDEYKRKPRRSQ